MKTLMLAVAFVTSSIAVAQPLQLLDCIEVNLLSTACEEPGDNPDAAPTPPPPVPEPPLFTLQTMHPSTPPLMLQALNHPTPANIEAFLDWEQRYLARTLEVEALLKQRRQQRKR